MNTQIAQVAQTPVSRSTVRDLLKSAEGYPLIGTLIYWSISDVKIQHEEFVSLLASVGLDPELAPGIKPKSALIRAVRSGAKGSKRFHRHVVDNKERAGFAIVSSNTVNENNVDIEFETATKVIFDKQTNQVTIEGDGGEAIQEAFLANKDLYTSDKFRSIVLKIIRTECQGLSIRGRGGIYFVPSVYNSTLEKLQKLFAYFPGCSLESVPVVDTAEAKKTTWKAFTSEVKEEIDALKADLAGLEDNPSTYSLEVRTDKYATLKDKVENYEFLLSESASDLREELEGLTKALKAKLIS